MAGGDLEPAQGSGDWSRPGSTVGAVRDERGAVNNYVAIFSDISAIKASHERIEHLATHDELTGLPNRNLFGDRVKHAIARAGNRGERLYVLFVDLDNFKVINDNLGHDAGDDLLRQAAARLIECVRPQDTVARLGGDEFILLLEDADSDRMSILGRRILDYLSASYRVQGREVYVTASLGICRLPGGRARQRVLAQGRGHRHVQGQGARQEPAPVFLCGNEATGRAARDDRDRHPARTPGGPVQTRLPAPGGLNEWADGGRRGPDPLERAPGGGPAGALHPGGRAVRTHRAGGRVGGAAGLRALTPWLDAGLDPVPVFVNVSPLQFRTADLVACLETRAEFLGVTARLGIELTEAAIMDGSRHHRRTARARARASSLCRRFRHRTLFIDYLQRYPIDGLKIDRSFVTGSPTTRTIRPSPRRSSGWPSALGVEVVAEGVEPGGPARRPGRAPLHPGPGVPVPSAAGGRGLRRAP